MSNLIRFQARTPCPSCGAILRPATQHEIEQGLSDPDPIRRQAFAHAVQGDMNRKFTIENRFTEKMETETPAGSWLLLCKKCGCTSVHLKEEFLE